MFGEFCNLGSYKFTKMWKFRALIACSSNPNGAKSLTKRENFLIKGDEIWHRLTNQKTKTTYNEVLHALGSSRCYDDQHYTSHQTSVKSLSSRWQRPRQHRPRQHRGQDWWHWCYHGPWIGLPDNCAKWRPRSHRRQGWPHRLRVRSWLQCRWRWRSQRCIWRCKWPRRWRHGRNSSQDCYRHLCPRSRWHNQRPHW